MQDRYNGNFPIDGTYTLIVHATDVSKNKSGSNDYQINFDVINKATITEVMNWPILLQQQHILFSHLQVLLFLHILRFRS